MNDKSLEVIEEFKRQSSKLTQFQITTGFDAFIDTIVRLVKDKNKEFNTIHEFGEYILNKSSGSFSLESRELITKMGGNMLIMSDALGKLGLKVNCIGSFGKNEVHTAFRGVSQNCTFYSFADAGTCLAVEFDNGKMMIANMTQLNQSDWSFIKNKIGLEQIIELFQLSDAFCLLNWGEILTSNDLWNGILKEILPQINKPKFSFFDLSDFTKRDTGEIHQAFVLLKEFANKTKLILSLNQNEAKMFYKVIFNESSNDFSWICKKFYNELNIENVIIHSAKKSYGIDKNGTVEVGCFSIENPEILTGAGDNFNAGFLAGKLLGYDLKSNLRLANALAAEYIKGQF